MSLDTIIHAGLSSARRSETLCPALVLMGGGARTAYQVGVLRGLATILGLSHRPGLRFPFSILVGTSAGALNASFLAGAASKGLSAFQELSDFWGEIQSDRVYQLNVAHWARSSRILAAVSLSREARRKGAILDNMPLVDTLHQAISLPGIDYALQSGVLQALAVTASSYTTGVHWTFCHTRADRHHDSWNRPGRRAEFQPITIEHLMASSAIPFLFPATPLWVDGQQEYFGDGSMRQISPLSPALHLGASKVVVIGVGQPQRAGLAQHNPTAGFRPPSLATIAGHAMASVFHDTVQADVEQTERVTRTLQQMPREVAAYMPYRPIEVLSIQPSQSLDAIAQQHILEMPEATRQALGGRGGLKGGGAALASYLLFEQGFIQAMIALGERDAYNRKAEITTFFADSHFAAVQ